MRVYTIHEMADPPADRIDRAEALRFVREGFSWSAAIFAPLWMLVKGLWLALVLYIAVTVLLSVGITAAGLSSEMASVLFLALHVLIGFEADTIQRWTLARNGWQTVGAITGRDALDCERRFFDVWLPEQPMLRPETLSSSHFLGNGDSAAGIRRSGGRPGPWRSAFSSLRRR